MSDTTLAKVMKFELNYIDGCGDFHEMQKTLWELQKQSREILNKTIQLLYHWDLQDIEYQRKTGEHLNVFEITGSKRLDGYIYRQLTPEYPDMAAANTNATIQKAYKKFNSSRADIRRGTMSLPSYRSNQPIIVNKDSYKLSDDTGVPTAEFTLLSNKAKKEKEIKTNVVFAVKLCDGTQRSIFNNILSGVYGKSQCQIVYDKPKWFMLLTYTFSPMKVQLDPDKILGVDLGEVYAICASTFGQFGSLRIDGGEIPAFAKKAEARRIALQRQASRCGDGRIGHGTKTRVSNVYDVKERIANFRNTINHRYSKALIDYAVKNGCGTIQMEDLTGIKENTGFPRVLQHWTYYDLQQKIENKAKEKGIRVVKIDPKYTSQRCSKCGYISKDNRKSQSDFKCQKCGFSQNADYNASQNISIKDIELIISESLSANM